MEPRFLYEDILGMLTIIKNDEKKLMAVLACLENELLGEEQPRERQFGLPDCESAVTKVAEALYNSYVCYLNPDTMEIEQLRQDTYLDADDNSKQNDDTPGEFDLNFMKWDSYIKFEPPGPNELLSMMEKYVSGLHDSIVGSRLVSALDDFAPVSSFLKTIAECGQTTDWLDFRKKETVIYANNILKAELYQLNEA